MTQPRKPAFVFFVPSNDRAAIKIDERERGRKMFEKNVARVRDENWIELWFRAIKNFEAIFISVLKEGGEDEKRAKASEFSTNDLREFLSFFSRKYLEN